MKTEKHIRNLVGLLKDIRKEPSPAVVGFIYSTALVHMFSIVFKEDLDPSMMIKHTDFKSAQRIESLKLKIRDFDEKDELFANWKNMEDKRNELCYGNPTQKDIQEYIDYFYAIKGTLEKLGKIKFEIEPLEQGLEGVK